MSKAMLFGYYYFTILLGYINFVHVKGYAICNILLLQYATCIFEFICQTFRQHCHPDLGDTVGSFTLKKSANIQSDTYFNIFIYALHLNEPRHVETCKEPM